MIITFLIEWLRIKTALTIKENSNKNSKSKNTNEKLLFSKTFMDFFFILFQFDSFWCDFFQFPFGFVLFFTFSHSIKWAQNEWNEIGKIPIGLVESFLYVRYQNLCVMFSCYKAYYFKCFFSSGCSCTYVYQ